MPLTRCKRAWLGLRGSGHHRGCYVSRTGREQRVEPQLGSFTFWFLSRLALVERHSSIPSQSSYLTDRQLKQSLRNWLERTMNQWWSQQRLQACAHQHGVRSTAWACSLVPVSLPGRCCTCPSMLVGEWGFVSVGGWS